MEFTPIISDKSIKALLFEEAKAINNGMKPRLIILSRKRFEEFANTDHVERLHYDRRGRLINTWHLVYRVYDVILNGGNDIMEFHLIRGCCIVEKLCGCEKYDKAYEGSDEIAYIE